MSDYWIRVRGGRRVLVNYGWGSITVPKKKTEDNHGDEAYGRAAIGAGSSDGSNGLVLDFAMIERVEIRVESVFRPSQEDVEIQYVLTGSAPTSPDCMHVLAADYIIPYATERSMDIDVDKMVRHVRGERPGPTDLFIQVHSHPNSGVAEPSEQDLTTWKSIGATVSAHFPGATILFGIHGVGVQAPGFVERTRPEKISPNTISWRSNTREHSLGLFSASATPYEVSYAD